MATKEGGDCYDHTIKEVRNKHKGDVMPKYQICNKGGIPHPRTSKEGDRRRAGRGAGVVRLQARRFSLQRLSDYDMVRRVKIRSNESIEQERGLQEDRAKETEVRAV